METGKSKVSLSPPKLSCNLCVSFFYIQMLQTMRKCVALASWGTSFLWMKKQVLVPCMYLIPWKIRPISFDMPLLYLSFSGPLMSCWYSCSFPVPVYMTALALPGCNVRLPVTWLMTSHSSPAGLTRVSGLIGV